MSEIKPYKDQKPEFQSVNESAMMYESSCRSVDDFIASIPMKGDIDSLNASVAAGVLAYEIVRQRLQ